LGGGLFEVETNKLDTCIRLRGVALESGQTDRRERVVPFEENFEGKLSRLEKIEVGVIVFPSGIQKLGTSRGRLGGGRKGEKFEDELPPWDKGPRRTSVGTELKEGQTVVGRGGKDARVRRWKKGSQIEMLSKINRASSERKKFKGKCLSQHRTRRVGSSTFGRQLHL